MKRISDYTAERDLAVLRLFYKIRTPYTTVIDICRHLAGHPAPRFWVSEERALRVMRKTFATGKLPPMSPLRRKMYADILCRVTALIAADPSLPLADAVFEVVNSPAPSFYISPDYVKTIIYRMLRAARA